MKVELLEGNKILITCECGQKHKIDFNFRGDDGENIADTLDVSMTIDGDTT